VGKRAPPRSPPRDLRRSRSHGPLRNRRPVRLRSLNPSLNRARFRNPRHGLLPSPSRNPSRARFPSLPLVRRRLRHSRNLSPSPGRFRRTRSTRRLPLVNPGWGVLREDCLAIAQVRETLVD
jgi:hypothetical protein